MITVLGVDPGKRKCGVAVVLQSVGPPEIRHREIVPTEQIAPRVADLLAAYRPQQIVVGDATMGREVLAQIQELAQAPPVASVPEAFSSQRARRRFLEDNPARGWARWIPIGLRVPDRPVDDYVAVLLAEEWLRQLNPNIMPR